MELNYQALADEAYGTGCATQDPFYAGVEALAQYLAGNPTDQRLLELLAHINRKANYPTR